MDDPAAVAYRNLFGMRLPSFVSLSRSSIACLLLGQLCLGHGPTAAQEKSGADAEWKGRAVSVRLDEDDLGDARSLRELARILERAAGDEAALVVLDLDVSSAAPFEDYRKTLDAISTADVRVVTLVNPNATGAGALLALASDAIYLSSSGIIGGAGVVLPEGDEDDDAAKRAAEAKLKQQQSVLEARARSLARSNGYRSEIAEAMVNGDVEIRIGDETISEKGKILTLTAEEATREWEGKPLLAAAVVEGIGDVLEKEKLSGEPLELTPRSFGESENRARLSRREEKDDGAKGETPEPGKDSLFGRREEASYRDKVVVLEVGQDTLATGKASFEFLDRTLKKAELDGAAAVVFEMDTPGGFAWYTEGLVLNSLQNVSYPTYTFVNSRAESAGAIIAVGTDHIYMRPAATIGSALVVGGAGQDLAESMEDKVTQMIIGTVRNVAELKGHNPDVAEAFVTRDKEVRIDGIVVHEAGNVLNLNTIRATEVIGGRPVLAKGVAASISDILRQEGIEADIIEAEPLGMEAFAHWVQKLSILLIVVGLAGAYLELNSPGFGLPGLVSVLCFSLFFFGNYLAGNLAGYELAVLLVLGLVLIGVEIFLFPGAIVPGAVGGALVLAALGLAMVDRVDLEWKWSGLPGSVSWMALFRESFIALAVGFVGALALIFAGMRFLPDTKFGSRLILQEAVAGGASLGSAEPAEAAAGKDEKSMEGALVGVSGETATDLVPSGKGRFEGRLLDVVSDGEFIGKGTPVVITAHEGSRIVVAKA